VRVASGPPRPEHASLSVTEAARRWAEPLGLVAGEAAAAALESGSGLPFLGGPAAFLSLRLIRADGTTAGIHPVTAIPLGWDALVAPLTQPPPRFAGLVPRLGPDGPLVMGIVNLTPDSFSGDGVAPTRAIAQGRAMLEAGADLLDIGGESTRPGATPVTAEEEAARILPVIRALAPLAPVSVDTRNAATMRAALAAGARIVNDVSALRHDPEAAAVVAAAGAPVVLMHMRGDDPRSMQQDPRYDDVALEVARHLAGRIAVAEAAGIPRTAIALDPGIGFGKTLDHNLALLRRLPLLAGLGCPLLVGASRKGFIGRLSGEAEAGRRAAGSVAAALFAASRGAAILRVHDVAETVQALRVWRACMAG
jgi:dihydropteroate synthase